MFFIHSGLVEVISPGHDGHTLARLGPGQFFGEVAVLLDVPRTATVRAITEVEVWELDKEKLTEVMAEFPEVEARVREVAESVFEMWKKKVGCVFLVFWGRREELSGGGKENCDFSFFSSYSHYYCLQEKEGQTPCLDIHTSESIVASESVKGSSIVRFVIPIPISLLFSSILNQPNQISHIFRLYLHCYISRLHPHYFAHLPNHSCPESFLHLQYCHRH